MVRIKKFTMCAHWALSWQEILFLFFYIIIIIIIIITSFYFSLEVETLIIQSES